MARGPDLFAAAVEERLATRAPLAARLRPRSLDEVHRFSRAQQDVLLPFVEEGLLVLIGATTENPFFSLTGPLLSRSTLFRLEPLTDDDLRTLALRALDDKERGLGDDATAIDD